MIKYKLRKYKNLDFRLYTLYFSVFVLSSLLLSCDLELPTFSSFETVSTPTLTATQAPVRIPRTSAVIMARAHGKKYQVSTPLLLGVMAQESGFNATAVSRAGAMGLMQIMPGTVQHINRNSQVRINSAFNPSQNIAGGSWYLRSLYNEFKGWPESQRWQLALASYNGGPQRVKNAIARVQALTGQKRTGIEWSDIASYMPRETRHYVPAVISHEKYFKNWLQGSTKYE